MDHSPPSTFTSTSPQDSLQNLMNAYHKIIKYEYEKYRKFGFKGTWLSKEEIEELKIPSHILNELINRGFVLEINTKSGVKYHSLLMDIAFRASDIRIKYGGTKHVFETALELRENPFQEFNYVLFDRHDDKLNRLKEIFSEFIGTENANKFLNALIKAGIRGLSKYQYESIIQLLTYSKKNVVICAPTAFGKTKIFTIPILLHVIRNVLNNKKGVFAVLFYPRKSLSSDQMSEFIKLIYYINRELGIKITIGIDDGDTRSKSELEREMKEQEQQVTFFRGITCPLHSAEDEENRLVLKRDGEKYRVLCEKCKEYFDFIKAVREDIEEEPPNILITNIWAYQYRLTKQNLWSNGYLGENIEFFVFDEIHAYSGIVAGILRYFIRILKSLVSPNARIIFSSATIPKLDEFITEISGQPIGEFLKLVYNEKEHGADGRKLELYLLVGLNPLTSWETYVHQLAIFLSTINRLRSWKNVQSLIFVDSVREIQRLHDEAREAIKLGDPRDHLDTRIMPEDPYCYWIYHNYNGYNELDNPQVREQFLMELRNEILQNIETHYSEKPDRFEIEKRLKKGKIDVVFTTSTLELGVNYDKVMVVVNVGIPFSLESIVQRVGRAGRDAETTLRTSLSIIVIRNNPIEYFYLYKGLDSLIDVEKLPKKPVSYTNAYVAFYSSLLYAAAYLAKNKEDVNVIDNEDKLLEFIEKAEDLYNKVAAKDLQISIDLGPMFKKTREVVEILKKEPDIHAKYEQIRQLRRRESIIQELNDSIENLQNLCKGLNEMLEKAPQKDDFIKQVINRLKEFDSALSKLKNSISSSAELPTETVQKHGRELATASYDLQATLSKIPYHPYHDKLKRIVSQIEEKERNIRKLIFEITELAQNVQKVSEEGREDESKYLKAIDIYDLLEDKKHRPHIIHVIETLIGFKFMGNEFLDQLVDIEVKGGEAKEDIPLSTVMVRLPPYEVIALPFEKDQGITKIIGARYFWFPKPEKGEILRRSHGKHSSIIEICNEICYDADGLKYGDIFIPDKIYLGDLLAISEPIIIKIKCGQRDFFIKYGSEKIIKGLGFSKQGIQYNRNVLEKLEKLEEEVRDDGNNWGLNFRYVGYCKLGHGISTDPYDIHRCPFYKWCDFQRDCYEGGRDKEFKYWSNSRRIFPKFYLNLKIKIEEAAKLPTPLTVAVGTRLYDELEKEITFMYDSVSTLIPYWYGDFIPCTFKIRPSIGYLAKTSFVYLKFNKIFLDAILQNILRDEELLNILKFKFYIYSRLQEGKTLLSAVLNYERYDPNSIDVHSNEFTDFITRSLLHSLAHLFYLFLVRTKIQINPDRVVYYVDYDNNTIYIVENSRNNGMGLAETIKQEIMKYGEWKLVEEFIEWAMELLEKHEEDVRKLKEELKNDAERSLQEAEKINNKIKELKKHIGKLNEEIDRKIGLKNIDLITYRYIQTHKLKDIKDISEELSEYILPVILSFGNLELCLDGCSECLILHRGCSESPITQNYIVSRKLVKKFLEILKRGSCTITGSGIGKYLIGLMENAERIRIAVPFIDEYGLKYLLDYKKKGIDIKVVTRLNNVVDQLRNNGIPVKVHNELHAKMYLIEFRDEKVCLHGSPNLTRSSLESKDENLTIEWGSTAERCIGDLNMLFKKAM